MILSMSSFFATIKRFFREYRENYKAKALAVERKEVARVFNDLYTYVNQYDPDRPILTGSAPFGCLPKGGNAWMCPECNKIYHPYECSIWTGIQYPGCCSTGQGHRLYYNIRKE